MHLRALRTRSSIQFVTALYDGRPARPQGVRTGDDWRRPPAPASICGRFRYPTPSPTTSRESCPWPRRNPPPPPTTKTASRARRARISCSTSTTRSTGGRGDRKRWPRRSRAGKPILLSVGYAACHWCHVMAHESFEDDDTARVMNELFVNIKVDREERPDIDQIYMAALHHLGEQGGWPLTMFLTHDARADLGRHLLSEVRRATAGPAFVDVLREVRADVPRRAAEDRAEPRSADGAARRRRRGRRAGRSSAPPSSTTPRCSSAA